MRLIYTYRWIFWSETRDGLGQSTAVLKKSQMTGLEVENILDKQASVMAVSDLSFDLINKWLYFTDLPRKNVGRVTHNGTKFEIIFTVSVSNV